MKIIFVDEQDSSEHDASAADIAQLFKLADKLSESDLKKLERACKDLPEMEAKDDRRYI